jgi:hypothetical protein
LSSTKLNSLEDPRKTSCRHVLRNNLNLNFPKELEEFLSEINRMFDTARNAPPIREIFHSKVSYLLVEA